MTKGKKFGMYLFLIIMSFISVFPLYWMACAATNKSVDVLAGRIIPGGYLIENWKNLAANQNVGRAMGNSFKYHHMVGDLPHCGLALRRVPDETVF